MQPAFVTTAGPSAGRTGYRATTIDPGAHTVTATTPGGGTITLGYDRLVIGTDAVPARPPIAGLDDGVHVLHTMGDTFALLDSLNARQARTAIIVGAGYIGLEGPGAARHQVKCPRFRLVVTVRAFVGLDRLPVSARPWYPCRASFLPAPDPVEVGDKFRLRRLRAQESAGDRAPSRTANPYHQDPRARPWHHPDRTGEASGTMRVGCIDRLRRQITATTASWRLSTESPAPPTEPRGAHRPAHRCRPRSGDSVEVGEASTGSTLRWCERT
ncbi:FAD-dependent oxidoreductase [Actinoplanes sp. NPDC051470]|uniref:NAD(P)/FAD-dependent oxidoreductase n=1 Tax=Actinoplanes sp. NPDC051470 TaxID=3157224 RepID=UPI0034255EA3